MKKLLGISLVAVLAATPMMASAADPTAHSAVDYNLTASESGQTYNENVTPKAAAGKYFTGKAVTVEDASKVATGAYVKGAYNAAISAINAVAEATTTSAGEGIAKNENGKISLDVTKDGATNISGLQFDGSGDSATVSIDAGDAIKVDANGVSVNLTENKGLQIDSTNKTLEINKGDGLGFDATTGALEVNLTDKKGLQIDSTNKTLEINKGDGLAFDATTGALKVDLKENGGLATDGNGKLYVDGAENFATQTGVVNTIKSSYVNAVTDATLSNNGVTALTTWGNDSNTTTLGAAELVVTRQNVGVQVTNQGTEQEPAFYSETAATITAGTQTKTTPGDGETTPAWTNQ